MSLLDAAERFATLDRSQVVLAPGRCLHSQDQASECTACFGVCPVQAIAAGKPPVLDTELCKSCLACLPVCPVGAYHADDDVASLMGCAAHMDGEAVELLCGLHPHPETGISPDAIGIRIRGCLAGLGTGSYLALSAMGLDRLTARTDACRACTWQALGPEIYRQVERAGRFLSAWDRGKGVTCLDDVESPVDRALWDARNPPLSRRDLFRLMARQGQIAMARAMEDSVDERKRQPGRDRLRLLAAVSHLAEPASSADLEGFGFATLAISASCTACGACGKACPTKALCFEKNEEKMVFSITFSAFKCIDCDLCEHVCLPDAILLDHSPAFEQVFEEREPVLVKAGDLARCERCRTLVAKRDGRRLCPLCEYRRTNPFGSMMPRKRIKESRS